jgi:hypothetical protein
MDPHFWVARIFRNVITALRMWRYWIKPENAISVVASWCCGMAKMVSFTDAQIIRIAIMRLMSFGINFDDYILLRRKCFTPSPI